MTWLEHFGRRLSMKRGLASQRNGSVLLLSPFQSYFYGTNTFRTSTNKKKSNVQLNWAMFKFVCDNVIATPSWQCKCDLSKLLTSNRLPTRAHFISRISDYIVNFNVMKELYLRLQSRLSTYVQHKHNGFHSQCCHGYQQWSSRRQQQISQPALAAKRSFCSTG